MCAAKTLTQLIRLGMELSRQGQIRAGLMLLARALRQTLRLDKPLAQAVVRNNLALLFQLQGAPRLAMRQLDRAMSLVEANSAPGSRFHNLLRTSHDRLGCQAVAA